MNQQPLPPTRMSTLLWALSACFFSFSIGMHIHQFYWSRTRASYKSIINRQGKIISNYQLTLGFHVRTIDSLRTANKDQATLLKHYQSVARRQTATH